MLALSGIILISSSYISEDDKDLKKVKEFQAKLKKAIEKTRPAYVFIGGGSGVLISKDGWILTNNHVAGASGKTHSVKLPGGKTYSAKVIGHDTQWDVDLLKIDGHDNLPFVEMGDSDKTDVGDHCFAIGNPWGLGKGSWDPTITFGVLSAKDIYFDAYSAALQTDAQINPGNSGGPLLDMEGRLIGINGRIQWRLVGRVNTGLGYAIPISAIKRFLPKFKKGGRVRRAFLHGVTLAEPDFAQYEEGEYGDGVLAAGVTDETPCAKAGLLPGDLITELGGFRTFNLNRLHGIVGSFPPGEKVEIIYKRRDSKGSWSVHKAIVELGDPDQTKRLEEEKKKKEEEEGE